MNTTTCAFCDDETFRSNNLILWETAHQWTIASFGQISEGTLNYIPKTHVPCFGAMEKEQIEQSILDINQIRQILTKKYGKNSFVMFEHGIVGQTIDHVHMHFIPGTPELRKKIWSDFSICSADMVGNLDEFMHLYEKKDQPYLLWQESYSDKINIIWNPPAPKQYLRTISAEAIGRPERADWRTMDPIKDKFLRQATIHNLQPHFESLQVCESLT